MGMATSTTARPVVSLMPTSSAGWRMVQMPAFEGSTSTQYNGSFQLAGIFAKLTGISSSYSVDGQALKPPVAMAVTNACCWLSFDAALLQQPARAGSGSHQPGGLSRAGAIGPHRAVFDAPMGEAVIWTHTPLTE